MLKSSALTPPTTATVIPSQLQRAKQPYPILTTSLASDAYPSPVANKEEQKEEAVSSTAANLLQLAGKLGSPSSSLFAPLKSSDMFGSPSGFDYGLSFPMENFSTDAFYRPGMLSPNSTALAHAAVAAAATIPEAGTTADFYLPEFHEYSRQHYEMSVNPNMRKRMKLGNVAEEAQNLEDEHDESRAAEIRRQIHIQSEQKRRAQIKDGFEELRKHLPNCVNKKISKAAILTKTVMYLQQLKNSHFQLAQELERVQVENERLKQFQEQVLQKQALDKIYSIGL